ncbi:hypothetical protein ERO13_A11G032366v2 [Gossypium hirsutum]|nr:hypothetical protein ERO13_A11G032366v2 [Gossypium hirsutum]
MVRRGGDQMDQFHRNEAISAVADEGFLGEEDDDYEDLYNDVNVGEGFLQSLRKNEDLGFRNEETKNSANNVVNNNDIGEKVGGSPMDAAPEPGVSNPGLRMVLEEGILGFLMRVKGLEVVLFVNVKGPSAGSDSGGNGLRVELERASSKLNDMAAEQSRNNINNNLSGVGGMAQQGHGVGNMGSVENESLMRHGGVGAGNVKWWWCQWSYDWEWCGNVGVAGAVPGLGPGPGVGASGGGSGGGGSGTILFVGDLHWWTTDAELESELCKYGPVKEVKFFDEKATAATACKEGMNGHIFNGRPCVVAFASPFTVKKMGEAQLNRNQQMAQSALSQARRGPNDAGGKTVGNNIQTGGNYQGGDNNRGIGATPPLLHPQSMMGQGFGPALVDHGENGWLWRLSWCSNASIFWDVNSFPPVGGVGLPGVAPHVNPAFFGRGMPMNGMGMMPTGGVDGPNMECGQIPAWEDGVRTGYDRDMPGEKDTGHGHDWPERGHQDDRDTGREHRDRNRDRERDRDRDRDRHREDKDRYAIIIGTGTEEEHRSRSRDADYGKRRRLTSD